MTSEETVHVFLKCMGTACDYVHDYMRKHQGLYVCALPKSYTWDSIRARLRRKEKKGFDASFKLKDELCCRKCGASIWVFEVAHHSARTFRDAFDDAQIHEPRNMKTDGEMREGSVERKELTLKPVDCYLDIDNPQTDTYRDLIAEVNSCYANEAYSATIVLVRKIIENLIVDLFRKRYGFKGVDLFFRTDQKRFQDLSRLIENLRARISDFGIFGLEKKHLNMIEKLREEANSKAHCVIDHATIDELKSLRSVARKTIKSLLHVRELLFKGIE